MALDPKYVLAPSLEMYFVNKDSGLPLSGGFVYFYRDEDRNVPKEVYQLSGTQQNYTYTVLPNPCQLSSVGTFQDGSGNDILPYYYPFDVQGNIDLYYVEVYDSDMVLQFTREGWPNYTEANVEADQDITNFVPNGQFLLHNDAPDNDPLSGAQVATTVAYGGTIGTMEVYEIAQGGWTFERNQGSTATDSVTFQRYGSSVQQPTGNPRYAVKIATTLAGSDTAKDLCLTFPDVNTFSSDNLEYNLYFQGQTSSGDITAEIYIRKYFGAGGSASIEENITSVLLQPSIGAYNTTLLFGTNETYTIGTGDDDFVQVIIRLPPQGTQTVILTNFALTITNSTLTAFPSQTNAKQLDESTAGWLPTPIPTDGSAFYVPVVLTAKGMTFDYGMIGKIYASPLAPGDGELLCNGSGYSTIGYSNLGIPYSRLGNVYWNDSTKQMKFGTGYEFASSILSTTNTSLIFLATNIAGGNTFPADSVSVPTQTGFTFTPIVTGLSSKNQKCYMSSANSIFVRTNSISSGLALPTSGNSGFTVTVARATPSVPLMYNITTTAAAAITPGHYYTFSTSTSNYYVWFRIDGVGADPAPGGAGVRVDLLSTWSAVEVANILFYVMNSCQESTILCIGGASVPAGSYFTFSTNVDTQDYYVWYQVGGSGTDPLISNRIGIKVVIGASDTAAQVATATVAAINYAYVGVPDLQGLFLRGFDPSKYFDLDGDSRSGTIAGIYGNQLGTFEVDALLEHRHAPAAPGTNFITNNTGGGNTVGGGNIGSTSQTTYVGSNEDRPYNMVMNWVTRY
ncbi:MAG: hypothetical protein WC753_04780 [Candidatus Gracilibacteria bacterium]|jgi:hypothetical protein